MRFVIYAYESTYGGLHGIYDICVTEADSLDEADDIGETMAYEVIDTYSHLFTNDEDENYEATSPEWEYTRILPKWDNIPTAELDAEAAELGYEEFVNKYCKFERIGKLLQSKTGCAFAQPVPFTIILLLVRLQHSCRHGVCKLR